jgi:RNA polymerase sigma-70 factor (ECF subfamily)
LGDKNLSPGEIAALYERQGGALAAYACTFVNDFAAAEDVVHQVFLKLLGHETVIPDQPIAYLYRAVRNTALNAQRAGKRETVLDDATESPVFQHHNGDRAAAVALQATLAELPAEQRETVIMRMWSGLTLEEISAATCVPLRTVASRYRYALEKLRSRLKPYESAASGKG